MLADVWHIYAWNLTYVVAASIILVCTWIILARCAGVAAGASAGATACAGTGADAPSPKAACFFTVANIVFAVVAFAAILKFAVIGRTPGSEHIFMITSGIHGEEFMREMVMNAFLFLPLGVFLPFAVHGVAVWRTRGSARRSGDAAPKGEIANARIRPIVFAVMFAFLLSVGIEFWQYAAGTGTAQITDVLCNTAGAAIGSLAFACALT